MQSILGWSPPNLFVANFSNDASPSLILILENKTDFSMGSDNVKHPKSSLFRVLTIFSQDRYIKCTNIFIQPITFFIIINLSFC